MSLGLGSLITVLLGFGVNWVFGLVVGGIVTFFSFKIPKPIFNYMVSQRIIAYQNQMVDGTTLLSNGLRAGLSVPQSLAMVVDKMPAPISEGCHPSAK